MMLILLTTWACTHQRELPSDAEGFSQCDSGAGATEVEPKGTKKGVCAKKLGEGGGCNEVT